MATAPWRKLVREDGAEWLVTTEDVHAKTKDELKKRDALDRGVQMPCKDWFQRQVRANADMKTRPRRNARDQGVIGPYPEIRQTFNRQLSDKLSDNLSDNGKHSIFCSSTENHERKKNIFFFFLILRGRIVAKCCVFTLRWCLIRQKH